MSVRHDSHGSHDSNTIHDGHDSHDSQMAIMGLDSLFAFLVSSSCEYNNISEHCLAHCSTRVYHRQPCLATLSNHSLLHRLLHDDDVDLNYSV